MLNPFTRSDPGRHLQLRARGWALCNGQLLPISQNTALFSLLGTGLRREQSNATFALPDLAWPRAAQRGPRAWPERLQHGRGRRGGIHRPPLGRLAEPFPWCARLRPSWRQFVPVRSRLGGTPPRVIRPYAGGAGANALMSPLTISVAGSDQGHENRQPYLVLNFPSSPCGDLPASELERYHSAAGRSRSRVRSDRHRWTPRQTSSSLW